jgi:hypothetical protein
LVTVQELDTGGLKGLPQDGDCCISRLRRPGLELANCHDADTGRSSELFLRPIKEGPGSTTLSRRHPRKDAPNSKASSIARSVQKR